MIVHNQLHARLHHTCCWQGERTWERKKSMSLRAHFVEVSAYHMIAQKVINLIAQSFYAHAGWRRLTSEDGSTPLQWTLDLRLIRLSTRQLEHQSRMSRSERQEGIYLAEQA